MLEPMDPLPTQPDDPRLSEWYHTIELAPGLVTKAIWDHRPTLPVCGLPESLKGKSALDVGTSDGFWAFELEKRGAERVVAIDIPCAGAADILPRRRKQISERELNSQNRPQHFATAHKMLGSRVQYEWCSVYDLTPEKFGTFDVVYCGSLLLHLANPMQALINIRNVTKEILVIESPIFHTDPLEATFPDRPYAWFGRLDWEGDTPGADVGYWSFSPRALSDMLIYAGFEATEILPTYKMQRAGHPTGLTTTPIIAHVEPKPELAQARSSQVRVDAKHELPPPAQLRSFVRRLMNKMRVG